MTYLSTALLNVALVVGLLLVTKWYLNKKLTQLRNLKSFFGAFSLCMVGLWVAFPYRVLIFAETIKFLANFKAGCGKFQDCCRLNLADLLKFHIHI